jgi:ABC-2 type transport system ATP-binding protein
MYEIEELCDRIAVVNHGRVVALDTPAALKSRSSGESVIVIHTPDGEQSLHGRLDALRPLVTRLDASGG